MIWVYRLSVRAVTRGKRLLVVALLLLVPALLTLAYAASETQPDGKHFAVALFDQLVLPVLLPLTATLLATSALGGEIEDRTLIYLTLRPLSRLGLVLGKLMATAVINVLLVAVTLALMYGIAAQATSSTSLVDQGAGDQVLGALLLAGVAGTLVYDALFLLVGLLAPRRGLLIGFIYVLAWEGTAAGLSGALATFSIRRYVQGLLNSTINNERLANINPTSLSTNASLLVLAAVALLSVALTTVRLKRLQLP